MEADTREFLDQFGTQLRKQEQRLSDAQRRPQETQASEIMNSRQIGCSSLNKYVSLNSKNKQQLEHFSDHFDML